MSFDILSFDTEPPNSQDWQELSRHGDWWDLITEQDIDATHRYTVSVRQLFCRTPGVSAGLEEIGGLLMVGTLREAIRVALCVLLLEDLGQRRRTGTGTWTSVQA